MSRRDERMLEVAQVLAGIGDAEARVLAARAVAMASELDAVDLVDIAGHMAEGRGFYWHGMSFAPQLALFPDMERAEYARVG